MSQFLGRYTLTAGKTTIASVPTDGVAAIVISNDSAFSVVATLEGGGSSLNIAAGVADMMQVQNRSFTGNLLLAASSQLSIQNSPANQAEVNIYGVGEQIPSVYPLSLNRVSNSGNSVDLQGQLLIFSDSSFNNTSDTIGGLTGKTVYLSGFDVTGSHASSQTKGLLTISGLSTAVDPNGLNLHYELEVVTSGPMPILERWYATPLPGVSGAGLTFTIAALSDATIALNVYYYRN